MWDSGRTALALALGWSLWLTTAPVAAKQENEEEDRSRIAYVIEVVPKGTAEKAMVEYHKWTAEGGKSVPLDGKTAFGDLSDSQQKNVRGLMEKMYAAAGEDAHGFKHVALLLDKGLPTPSKEFLDAGYSAEKIPNELSVMMAQARDHWIEQTIQKVTKNKSPPIKICRSDSGNTTSGMKSDLDQTFYVYEWDEAKQDWVRPTPIEKARDADAKFIAEFEEIWTKDLRPLTLGRLDTASIAGANRFPDVRATDILDHGKAVRTTIVELRLTPGAYTTYGAVMQQTQLRALGGILAAAKDSTDVAKRRAFQQYTKDGKVLLDDDGKPIGFDDELARKTMFGEGLDPKIRHGLAFGAAVANFIELEHYMNDPKFETKYHLRTWDDAEFTHRLVEQGEDAAQKEDYTKLTPDQRAEYNRQMLKRLFAGDEAGQHRHHLALDASAALRNVHKGEVGKIDQFRNLTPDEFDKLSDFEKKRPVFEALSRELFPTEWAAVDKNPDTSAGRVEKLIFDAEQQHRTLAAEFCMRSICENARETLGMIFDLDSDKPLIVDPKKVRHAVQGVPQIPFSREHYDQQWEKIRDNLKAEARETMLFAFYDLGEQQGAKLRDFLKAEYPDRAAKIDKLYDESRNKGWDSFMEYKGLYARYYGRKVTDKISHLNRHVHRHVLGELGFNDVEKMRHAGQWLKLQDVTWNWRKFARNAVWDPGSFDAAAQIWRSVYESGGDIDVVLDKIADEMFLAIPVIGQIESVRRGGYFAAGMMVVAMKVPQIGLVMVAYSLGEAMYAVYDMEYERPKRENIVDAVFRGFTGPERIEYGMPGKLPPVWNDSDDTQLAKLRNDLRDVRGSRSGTLGANVGQIDAARSGELGKQIAALEQRKAEFRKYRDEDANWYGGLVTGEAAFNEFHALEHFILDDVTPRVAFLSRKTIDRQVLDRFNPDSYEGDRAALEAQQNNETEVMASLEASRKLYELKAIKRRYDDATSALAKLKDTPELRYRFKRDSLYPYLHEKYGELDVEKIDRWTYVWYKQNEEAVIEELVGIGLLDAEARNWKARAQDAVQQAQRDRVANSRTGVATPLSAEQTREIFDKHRPINLQLLKQRVHSEVARSRNLYEGYQQIEKDRAAVLDRNLETAKQQYGIEMARPGWKRRSTSRNQRRLRPAARARGRRSTFPSRPRSPATRLSTCRRTRWSRRSFPLPMV